MQTIYSLISEKISAEMIHVYILAPPFSMENNLVSFIQSNIDSAYKHLKLCTSSITFCKSHKKCSKIQTENSTNIFIYLAGKTKLHFKN